MSLLVSLAFEHGTVRTDSGTHEYTSYTVRTDPGTHTHTHLTL